MLNYLFQIIDHRLIMKNAVHKQNNRVVGAWPNESWRSKAMVSWEGANIKGGTVGTVVHRWEPGHPESTKRSLVGKTVVLLRVDGYYVPVLETGIRPCVSEI